jgi:hypothetical protein
LINKIIHHLLHSPKIIIKIPIIINKILTQTIQSHKIHQIYKSYREYNKNLFQNLFNKHQNKHLNKIKRIIIFHLISSHHQILSNLKYNLKHKLLHKLKIKLIHLHLSNSLVVLNQFKKTKTKNNKTKKIMISQTLQTFGDDFHIYFNL